MEKEPTCEHTLYVLLQEMIQGQLGTERGSDQPYWACRGLERLREEIVSEYLYMNRCLPNGQGGGACSRQRKHIDNGIEVGGTWCVPEASSLFQEALSTGQCGVPPKTGSSGSRQGRSRVELKSSRVPSKELQPYLLDNRESLEGSKPRSNTSRFIH